MRPRRCTCSRTEPEPETTTARWQNGKIELWIDDTTWQGAWNRKFSWQGELLNVYQVMGFASADFDAKERFWGSTQGFQFSEAIKAERATVSGMNGRGADPANDRRVALVTGEVRGDDTVDAGGHREESSHSAGSSQASRQPPRFRGPLLHLNPRTESEAMVAVEWMRRWLAREPYSVRVRCARG